MVPTSFFVTTTHRRPLRTKMVGRSLLSAAYCHPGRGGCNTRITIDGIGVLENHVA